MYQPTENSYEVGDLIKVYGNILSLNPSKYPAPQWSKIVIDASEENIVLEGQVVSVSENGQVREFKILSSLDNSSLIGSIVDTNSFDDLHIENLTNS